MTGNLIKFKSGALTCIKSNMILKMLITNTKVGRNTKALVAGVSERKNRHPDAMTSVFTAVDSISNELASIIQSSSDDDLTKEQKVEELMEMNQGLLKCMGVSHASIEMVLRTTLKYKLTSKLTGAGGGGCVLTLLPARILFTIPFTSAFRFFHHTYILVTYVVLLLNSVSLLFLKILYLKDTFYFECIKPKILYLKDNLSILCSLFFFFFLHIQIFFPHNLILIFVILEPRYVHC